MGRMYMIILLYVIIGININGYYGYSVKENKEEKIIQSNNNVEKSKNDENNKKISFLSNKNVPKVGGSEKVYMKAAVTFPEIFVQGQPKVVSQNKRTRQTGEDKDGDNSRKSGLAVDGDKNENVNKVLSCTQTGEDDDYTYWQVDLGENYDLDRVEITSRPDCCNEGNIDYYVYARDDDKVDLRDDDKGRCAPLQEEAYDNGETKLINCFINKVRYVTLWKDNKLKNTKNKSFNLCEVEVYGYRSESQREQNEIIQSLVNLDIAKRSS